MIDDTFWKAQTACMLLKERHPPTSIPKTSIQMEHEKNYPVNCIKIVSLT